MSTNWPRPETNTIIIYIYINCQHISSTTIANANPNIFVVDVSLCSTEADCYENLAEPPDYVSLDDQIVPPPYIKNLSQECCYDKHSVSSEDYDDIGKNDCNEGRQSEEDYDDVG